MCKNLFCDVTKNLFPPKIGRFFKDQISTLCNLAFKRLRLVNYNLVGFRKNKLDHQQKHINYIEKYLYI